LLYEASRHAISRLIAGNCDPASACVQVDADLIDVIDRLFPSAAVASNLMDA
jgi:hypothetical protein